MYKPATMTNTQKLVDRLAGSLLVPPAYRGKDTETMIAEAKRAHIGARSVRVKEFATFDVKLKKKFVS